MPWNGTAFDPDGGYPDIVYYIWDFGEENRKIER
jgi:hypothetical protein